MHKLLLSLILLVISSYSIAQCPTANVVLDSQQKVNEFIQAYPDCTNLNVDLEINGSSISNLEGLKNLTSVKNLRIRGTSLVDLKGLDNLKSIDGDFYIGYNSLLTNLNGLQNLEEVIAENTSGYGTLKIELNRSLKNLEGIDDLERLESLWIYANTNLNSIEALNKIFGEIEFLIIEKNQALQSLKGLENIEKITGHLNLFENNLESLSALESLKSSGGVRIFREPSLHNFTGLEKLEYVDEYFVITNNNSITNLTGLESLTVADSLRFDLTNNPQLKSLKGLNNLKRIKDFQIYGQNNLSNLESLESLQILNGELSIKGNSSIINLKGLENLQSAKKILIDNNPALETLQHLSSLESNSEFIIYRNNELENLEGLENLRWTDHLEIQNNNNLTRLCDFRYLKEMGKLWIARNQNFKDLEGLDILEKAGDVTLSALPLTSLKGLQNLESAKSLIIYYLNNLQNLEGLDNLHSISDFLSIDSNENLTDISALKNLQSIGNSLFITNNDKLENLIGLENINSLNEYLSLSQNKTLQDIGSLKNIQFIGRSLTIQDNYQLETLNGLEGLRSVKSEINIYDNENLKSIDGLENVNLEILFDSPALTALSIIRNANLSECSIANICNYLSNEDLSNYAIGNNGTGCTSKEEILERCEEGLNSLAGKIGYNETGENCNENQFILNNILVETRGGDNTFSTSTDSSGIFYFLVDNDTYETSVRLNELQQEYFEATPVSILNTFPSSTTIDSLQFCLKKKINAKDVSIMLIPVSDPRPGFTSSYKLIYKNQGTETLSGNIDLEFEAAKVEYNSENENGLINFPFNDLKPFETRERSFSFKTLPPPTVNIRDSLTFTASINPGAGDKTPADNSFILKQEVIGSIDPNDIRVLEGEKITKAQVSNYLNYIIRFQNTGTAEAINVRIEHNLDDDLDWDTFIPITSSHNSRITIKGGKYVTYTFKDINLPDSTSNEPGSHGFVAFKIKPKSGIEIGDVIKANAGIYFDFNPPIITNEVSTTVINEVTADLTININSEISCFGESDAEIEVNLTGGTSPFKYMLYNENNNLIAESDNKTFSNLSAGNYSVKVTDSSSSEFTYDFKIDQPELLTAEIVTTMISCSSASDGEISLSVNGGAPPYTSSIDGTNYSDNNVFTGLTAGEYTICVKDSNQCIYSETVNVSEPTDSSDLDGDGQDDKCDDDIDGDGIPNEADNCKNSSRGEVVDENGCTIFSLPPTNFTITTTGETCRSSNDGKIEILTEASYDYTAELSNNELNISQEFTSSNIFENLAAGTYDLCLSISDIPNYEQCFSIQIDEPEVFEVNTTVSTTDRSVNIILKGSDHYIVQLNGNTYTTQDNELQLPLNTDMNVLTVKTNRNCQGVYEQNILLGSDIIVYPNPIDGGEVSIQLPSVTNDLLVRTMLYSDTGKIILRKKLRSTGGYIKLEVDGILPGVYIISIRTEKGSYYKKIIKS